MFQNSSNSLRKFSGWFGKLFSRTSAAARLSIGITKSRCNRRDGGGLDSTPESNPILRSGKGRTLMNDRASRLSQLLDCVSRATGFALARICRLCPGIEFSGIGISLIPGLVTWNINLRAGGSGRVHHATLRSTRYLRLRSLAISQPVSRVRQ